MLPSRAEFSASYDRATTFISAGVCMFFLVLCLALHNVVVISIAVLATFLGYAYSPRGYAVSGQGIVVRRLIGNVTFPLQGVREARRVGDDDLSGCIRLWGSGGMFGYYGLFRTSKLGKCWWYVTNRSNSIAVVTDAKAALFSPDDVDGFLAAIQSSSDFVMGRAGVSAAQGHESGPSVATVVGFGIGVLAIAVVAAALLYSPGLPSYTLTPEALTIHDRFYPVTVKAAEVDLAHISIVELTSDRNWRPSMRTNGFSNSHYHAGWFRAANGQSARMYWTDGKGVVILPPNGSGVPVLIEVKEPGRFIEELRNEWQRHRADGGSPAWPQ